MDMGVKRNILSSLTNRDIDIIVVPAGASPRQIREYEPDALLISNGPGDPLQAKNAIAVVKELVSEMPVLGICLGHQIIALALGARTYKLKFGHRGANQPVKDLHTGKVYITSQNHGFAVDPDSLDKTGLRITHINANDNTVEGIRHESLPIVGIQYHPEASPGLHDAEFLFDVFVEIMEGS
jgi:carbamoyl-phosphate synthase small subunit